MYTHTLRGGMFGVERTGGNKARRIEGHSGKSIINRVGASPGLHAEAMTHE